MFTVLLGMALIIVAGVMWRLLLGGKDAGSMRGHLAQAVYQVFLPALVLHVLWQTPVDLNSIRIPVVAAACVLLSLVLGFLVYGNGRLITAFLGSRPNRAIGALLLACGFGNFTYLGLPVVTQTFGPWAQFVAIQFDLLASTPLLFTVGILLARHYGQGNSKEHALSGLARVPALWAALGALGLSAAGVPMPGWLDEALATLGSAVVPLMLLSVGMALNWQKGWMSRVPVLFPVLVIQLLLMPLIALGMASALGLPANLHAPVIIEAAMPSMVLGLVICDRFRLDASLYAEAITLSTAVSLLTLPLWMSWSG